MRVAPSIYKYLYWKAELGKIINLNHSADNYSNDLKKSLTSTSCITNKTLVTKKWGIVLSKHFFTN